MLVEAIAQKSSRIRYYQRASLTLLIVSGAVNYVDRATLAVGSPLIRAELHLNILEMGGLLSAFLWAYAITQIPAGILVDRIGPRIVLGSALALWSIAQGVAGLSVSFIAMATMRVVLGIGEAPQSPSSAKVVRNWFSTRERGTATGIWNCGASLGSAISAPLLTWLMLSLGWRGMFFVMSALGLVAAVVWFCVYREPAHLRLEPEESAYLGIQEVPTPPRQSWEDWKMLLKARTTWGLSGGFFGIIYLIWIFASWLPTYLEMQHHLSIRQSGLITSLPFASGVAGSFLGGRWFDYWSSRPTATPLAARTPAAVSLVCVAGFTGLAAWTTTATAAVACICAAMFFAYVGAASAWGLVTIAVGKRYTASLGAIQNFSGYIGGACAAWLTGYIVQTTGSFAGALVVASIVGIVGALAYITLVSKPIELPD